ncbi:MAG: phytanoyl-CoA dioxygenase family protein [Planctomycetes bacterium]|nr:phytanoyl-CoA dioxygenase family protein [Planctomycetota bacterium]
MSTTSLTSCKQTLDLSPKRFGELKDNSGIAGDADALRARMEEDGYLLLRGLLNRDEVLAARGEVFSRLAEVGEVDTRYPVMEGISSGHSRRKELDDPGLFWKSVCEGPKLRRVTHAGAMMGFHKHFLGGQPRCFDYLWLRVVPVGHSTGCHYDVVYMGRGTRRLYTTWTPYGDISRADGTLMILEKSHQIEELLNDYAQIDVDKTPNRGGWFSTHPPEVAERFDRRWLTTDFRAGDILVFGMHTMHCSIDNASPVQRLRLSSDTRYQLASEPVDERWIGPNPLAHGRGYGEKR